jgi:hypothetical protein
MKKDQPMVAPVMGMALKKRRAPREAFQVILPSATERRILRDFLCFLPRLPSNAGATLGAHLPSVLHDEIRWRRNGAVDLPVYYRSSWGRPEANEPRGGVFCFILPNVKPNS